MLGKTKCAKCAVGFQGDAQLLYHNTFLTTSLPDLVGLLHLACKLMTVKIIIFHKPSTIYTFPSMHTMPGVPELHLAF